MTIGFADRQRARRVPLICSGFMTRSFTGRPFTSMACSVGAMV